MVVDTGHRNRPEDESLDRRAPRLGAKSGLVATVVMTAFRMPLAASPPPTAALWAQYVGGGEPGDHALVGLLLHLAYGTVAGALFGLLFGRPSGTEAARERRAVLRGVAYAAVLSVFGERVLLERLLGMDLEPDERFVFHASHVVYGLTLGAWVGSRAE